MVRHRFPLVAALVTAPLLSAMGQQPERAPDRPASARSSTASVVDTVPLPFEPPNGALLRAGAATYDLTIARAGQVTALGTRVVDVSEATANGGAAWLISETRTGSAVPTVDSLFLTRLALTPARWSAMSGRAQLGASFSHDTLFGALQSYQGRSSFTLATPANTLVTAGMLERIVELLPLASGYRVAAVLLVVEPGSPRLQSATLAVDGDERVLLGDRSVDCWVVTLRSALGEQRLWVSKDRALVVKTEQSFASGMLTSLLRLDPVPPAAQP